jgi:hypothetical protein
VASRARERWYLARALDARGGDGRSRGGGGSGRALLAACILPLAALAGCGAGHSQEKTEPSGDFRTEIVKATFPGKQKIAQRAQMVIAVRNASARVMPNVSVTVKSFDQRSKQPDVADPTRPRFVINTIPQGSETENRETYSGGPLKPGGIKTFTWNVTAVQPGPFRISYIVSAGLFGRARAVDSAGNIPKGVFNGDVNGRAPVTRVNFDNGRTVEPAPESSRSSSGR